MDKQQQAKLTAEYIAQLHAKIARLEAKVVQLETKSIHIDQTKSNDLTFIDLPQLPLTILVLIARLDLKTYRAMLAIPLFARTTLDPIINKKYRVWFTRKVRIYRDYLKDPGVETSYYLGTLRHRENGPALIHPDGTHDWWYLGKLHRDDGPARICHHYKEWYQHGELHRDDGPTVDHDDGDEEWYQHGKLHRTDGPALIFEGTRKCYINGKQVYMW